MYPSILSWPFPYDSVIESGIFREKNEDFRVEEHLSFTPTGSGEHSFLLIEKRGVNTQWLASELARQMGIHRRFVSYAGLKDKYAVARQWFSVHLPGKAMPDIVKEQTEFSILKHERHHKKLKQGCIEKNSFILILKSLKANQHHVETRLKQIAVKGIPNYFGRQRFGIHGNNIQAAEALLSGKLKTNRSKQSIYLSALRSKLFNDYLSMRVQDNTWDRVLEKDKLILSGTHSIFDVSVDDSMDKLQQRLNTGDLHIAGPLPGEDIETMFSFCHTQNEQWCYYCDLLKNKRIKTHWRALRVIPDNMAWHWLAEDQLRLSFDLPSGCFATTVLNALGDLSEPGAASALKDSESITL